MLCDIMPSVIMMNALYSRPEYIGVWLGLAKIGVIPALINFNLRQQALIHTIKVADCKGAIYGLEVESGKSR